MQALKQGGIQIPEEIAIAGFDNIILDEYISPKLSTIGIDHLHWGKEVAKAIVDLVKGLKTKDIGHPQGQFIIRESC